MKYCITDVTFFKFSVSYKASHTFIPYGSMSGIKVIVKWKYIASYISHNYLYFSYGLNLFLQTIVVAIKSKVII